MLRYEGEIALAVVELKMPGISGMDLANQISIERPETEVLYLSDQLNSIAAESISNARPQVLLPKPFSVGQLLDRVRYLLAA
jgi:DNA-binding NarL/FixJ family response regulator